MSHVYDQAAKAQALDAEARRKATLNVCWMMRDKDPSEIREMLDCLGLLDNTGSYMTAVPTLQGQANKSA